MSRARPSRTEPAADGIQPGRPPAPLLRDTWQLAEWLLARLEPVDRPLPRRVCALAIGLLEEVTRALRSTDPVPDLLDADDTLATLRLHLRLAERLGHLDEAQMLFALERADAVGRQVGGWLRSARRVG